MTIRILLTLSLLLAIASPAFAQVKETHRIVVRDSVYNVSSVKSTYREKIHKLNALRFKRGTEHVVFELTDSGYPLDVRKTDIPAKELKTIPDPRPFDVKHPVVSYGVKTGVNVACTLVGLFAGR